MFCDDCKQDRHNNCDGIARNILGIEGAYALCTCQNQEHDEDKETTG